MGDRAAQTTVRVYEDPRGAVVAEFELTGGALVLVERTICRQVKTGYALASFRDERLGGQARANARGRIGWTVNVDSTICRTHQHAAGARRGGHAQKEPPWPRGSREP
ncbi:hypothetical protein [Streptomyces xantholiticus]|uniref:hypothetical protein n=1 Tax=Streptomyces xantholiticus TaxID=68285 RepID=UPI003D9EF877